MALCSHNAHILGPFALFCIFFGDGNNGHYTPTRADPWANELTPFVVACLVFFVSITCILVLLDKKIVDKDKAAEAKPILVGDQTQGEREREQYKEQ
jgi:hypothetical protein